MGARMRISTGKNTISTLPQSHISFSYHKQFPTIVLRISQNKVSSMKNITMHALHPRESICQAFHGKQSQYSLGNLLGMGSFGSVYSAYDSRSKSLRAVKVMDKTKSSRRQLLHEIIPISTIRHPHIVKGYASFESESFVFVIMEYVHGGTLMDEINFYSKKRIAIREEYIARVIKGLLEAVLVLHNNGIVHRDIKPENILVGGTPYNPIHKLCDFGLSAIFQKKETNDEGMIMETRTGTRAYAAPEVFRSGPYDEKVDVWSVGVVAFIMLYNYSPFIEVLNHSGNVPLPINLYHVPLLEGSNRLCDRFLRSLLNVDPAKRLSCAASLHHKWITQFNSIPTSRKETVLEVVSSERMSDYTRYRIKIALTRLKFICRLRLIAKLLPEDGEVKEKNEAIDRHMDSCSSSDFTS